MKKKDFTDNLLNRELEILNETSPKDIIYDEVQIGPQEEPYLFEYHLDLKLWGDFLKKKNKKMY